MSIEESADHAVVNESTAIRESQIPKIIGGFAFRLRAIKLCAIEHLKFAAETQRSRLQDFMKQPWHGKTEFSNEELRYIQRQLSAVDVLIAAPHTDILSQSLLIFGFSTFDAFLGQFLRQLYHDVPTLIHKLDEKTIKISDLVRHATIDEAVKELIDRDITSLLRHSYNELFAMLATRHGLQTIKQFQTWPTFIEAAQRRNLITHCDGSVNSQYIDACKAVGCSLPKEVTNGTRLDVSVTYLLSAIDILHEVGVMLGHTLWRKSCPDKIRESETWLLRETYELITREEWNLAKRIGEFSINLPQQKGDLSNRDMRINYAQALKWSGDHEKALKILDAIDWTGSIRDLRLGVEVLRENFDGAARLMREIGRAGEMVNEDGYRTWPVFREFRKADQFKIAFQEIYGMPFMVDESPTKEHGGGLRQREASYDVEVTSDQRLPDEILKKFTGSVSTAEPHLEPDVDASEIMKTDLPSSYTKRKKRKRPS